MKKKISLFILLLFLCIPVANATNLDDWSQYVEAPVRLDFRNCTSSSNCSTSITTGYADMAGRPYQYSTGTISFTNGGNGVFVTEYVPVMAKGFVYSATNYICSYEVGSTNSKPIKNWSPSVMQSYNSMSIANTYSLQSPTQRLKSSAVILSDIPNTWSEDNSINCFVISDVFVATEDATYYGLRFGSTTTANVSSFYFFGFEFEQLGEYTAGVADEIKTYIDNSGLATATNVEELQQEVQELKTEIQELNNAQQETNDLITDNNTDDATNEAGNYFSGFESDTFGLTSIITAPINLISSIVGNSCSPVPVPIPFTDKTLNLPCLSTIYRQYFGDILTIYQIITFGIIAYWVCVQTFNMVKDFKNPDHDEIEVMDL